MWYLRVARGKCEDLPLNIGIARWEWPSFDRSDAGNAGSMQMSGNAEVEAFLEGYRAAFETFDASAIVDRFELPCQVTGDADEVGSTVVATRESWLRQVEQLLAAYRAITFARPRYWTSR
jgi:hypothetical protein